MTVLDCEEYERLSLQGHHLDSLVQLAVNKYSQVNKLTCKKMIL